MADAYGYLSCDRRGERQARPTDKAIRGPGRRRLFLLGTCLLPLLGLRGLCAQAPAPIQVVQFSAFASKPLTDVAFAPSANAAPQKVQFYPAARSPRYEYRGAMPLRFVDPETRAVVAEATIPAGMQQPLLLFSPIDPRAPGAGKVRYQVAVLDDSAARHGPGGIVVINLSGLTLAGTVNDRAVTLQSGLNPVMPIGRAAKLRFTTVYKQRTYQSYAGTANLRSDERALLILFPPFHPGALEVQSRLLVDRPSAGKSPAKK